MHEPVIGPSVMAPLVHLKVLHCLWVTGGPSTAPRRGVRVVAFMTETNLN